MTRTATGTRDAQRSRGAILDAAESLFALRGYDGVSLGEIAGEAGMSRGAPSYFFGSKASLYEAVLERAFAAREDAVARACAPMRSWAERDGDARGLRSALGSMAREYIGFLVSHPRFVRLMVRESLQGGARLHAAPHESRAIADAFERVRDSMRRRGRPPFEVDDAVLVVLGLTFAPVANRDTYVAKMRIDLDRPSDVDRLAKLAVGQLMALILGRER